MAVVAVKDKNSTFNSSYHKGLFEMSVPQGKNRFHPTQKPLKLFEELIRIHSNEGDLVVDPFVGSGTTAVAAKKLKREYYCSDFDEKYVNKANEILHNMKGIEK